MGLSYVRSPRAVACRRTRSPYAVRSPRAPGCLDVIEPPDLALRSEDEILDDEEPGEVVAGALSAGLPVAGLDLEAGEIAQVAQRRSAGLDDVTDVDAGAWSRRGRA